METAGDELIPMDSIACLKLDKELSRFGAARVNYDTLYVAVRKFQAARKVQQRRSKLESAGNDTGDGAIPGKSPAGPLGDGPEQSLQVCNV